MKESNTLAENAVNNFLKREVLLNTKGLFFKFMLRSNAAKDLFPEIGVPDQYLSSGDHIGQRYGP